VRRTTYAAANFPAWLQFGQDIYTELNRVWVINRVDTVRMAIGVMLSELHPTRRGHQLPGELSLAKTQGLRGVAVAAPPAVAPLGRARVATTVSAAHETTTIIERQVVGGAQYRRSFDSRAFDRGVLNVRATATSTP
jgi:hypothetical protein